MRKIFLSAMFALAVLGFQGEAKAQFCPGAPGTVFIDVPLSDPYCPQITWIAERGVTLGCQVINSAQSLYCPNDNVNRTQMAAFLNRLGNALFPLNCSVDQVMAWNGTMWVCASTPAGPAGPTGATGATGPMGPMGDPGPTGPAGATGATGAQGAAGVDGADGKTVLNGAVAPTTEGVDGDFYIDTVAVAIYGPKIGGVWGSAVSLVGPMGATGAAGPQGPAGADGAVGPVGPAGAVGPQGPAGPTGAQGPAGATGAQGPQGPAGPQGATGATGATGPQGPSGSAGQASIITTSNADYTVVATDYTILCNFSGGTKNVTLPAAASSTGRILVIRRIGGSVCSVSLVEGGALVLGNNDGVTVQSNGTFWYSISRN